MQNNTRATVEWKNTNLVVEEESRHIVRDLNGYANPNEILGIIGPSGGGKSAFLNALGGYVVDGIETQMVTKIYGIKVERKDVIKYIDYQTQFTPTLDQLTVIELLKYNIQIENGSIDKIESLLYSLELKEIIHNKVDTISVGEKARLSIAILLNSTKPILLFDEPLSPLDSYQAMFVINALKAKAAEGKTIIMTLHQPCLEILDSIDRFYVISNGRLLYFGALDNIEPFFENAGVALKIGENGNIIDAVLNEITLSDTDPTNLQSIKKLSTYLDSLGVDEKDLNIENYVLKNVVNQKNLFWYTYYLFITLVRNTISNVFSKSAIFLGWIPIFIFLLIPTYKPFLNNQTLNYYTFDFFKVYSQMLGCCGKIYLMYLNNIRVNGGISMINSEYAFNGLTQINSEEISKFADAWFLYVFMGMHFILRKLFVNPSYHLNIFRVMSYNAERGLFTYRESYFCFIFASAPLFIVSNLIADIYGMQTFDFEGVGFLTIPKYLVYTIGNIPIYLCCLGFYNKWFMKEILNMSFIKRTIIRFWAYLMVLTYIVTTILFCLLFYYLLLIENLDNFNRAMFYSFFITPFFEGCFLDFIAYSLVCITLFIVFFCLNAMIL